MGAFIIGADISAAHGGIVVRRLDTGEAIKTFYYTSKRKKDVVPELGGEFGLKNDKKVFAGDKDHFNMARLKYMSAMFNRWAYELRAHHIAGHPVYVSIEGYAFNAGSHQDIIGEITGALKLAFQSTLPQAKFRIHQPTRLKMYIAGLGNADKEDIYQEVIKWWPDLENYPDSDDVRYDLADAAGLSEMLRHELLIRSGDMHLKDLTEKQRQVFLTVGKGHSVNLLAREWC